jgi:hypothetical protein
MLFTVMTLSPALPDFHDSLSDKQKPHSTGRSANSGAAARPATHYELPGHVMNRPVACRLPHYPEGFVRDDGHARYATSSFALLPGTQRQQGAW